MYLYIHIIIHNMFVHVHVFGMCRSDVYISGVYNTCSGLCSLPTFDPQLSSVAERLAMYEGAIRAAKDKDDSTKVRRTPMPWKPSGLYRGRYLDIIYMYIKHINFMDMYYILQNGHHTTFLRFHKMWLACESYVYL